MYYDIRSEKTDLNRQQQQQQQKAQPVPAGTRSESDSMSSRSMSPKPRVRGPRESPPFVRHSLPNVLSDSDEKGNECVDVVIVCLRLTGLFCARVCVFLVVAHTPDKDVGASWSGNDNNNNNDDDNDDNDKHNNNNESTKRKSKAKRKKKRKISAEKTDSAKVLAAQSKHDSTSKSQQPRSSPDSSPTIEAKSLGKPKSKVKRAHRLATQAAASRYGFFNISDCFW
jgi:hypothetical protein